MKWLLGLGGLIIALMLGAIMMTYPQPFLKARDTVGTRYDSKFYPVNGNPDAALTYYVLSAPASDKPMIVLFASAGREVSDFNELASRLNKAGYPLTLIEAPGIGGAVPSQAAPTLFDLARDAHGIYRHHEKVVFLGHAFGNRVARASATLYDELTAGVILIAAGAERPVPEAANKALAKCFDPRLPIKTRTEAIRYGFFAGDNEIPDYWLRGWHAKTARLQGATRQNSPAAEWRAGGTAPMLVVTGLQDRIAPPEDTIDLLERDYPDRVTGVRIDGAGHAMLPEKPDEIAEAVLTWLANLTDQETET